MSPVEQVEQQAQAEQQKLYWDRHAGSTCGVLVLIVLLSSLAYPIKWQLVTGCCLGGICLHLAVLMEAQHKITLSTLFGIASIALAVLGAAAGGVLKGSLFWVQAVGTFFAATLATRVFIEGARDTSTKEKS